MERIGETFRDVVTMRQCMELTRTGEQPTLLAMYHAKGYEANVVAMVAAHIAALDIFLHLKNGLSKEEVIETAKSIVETYGGALSFADIKVVFDNARRGAYGSFYERLSSVEIMRWFGDWFDKRTCAAEADSVGEYERSLLRYKKDVRRKGKPITEFDDVYLKYLERITKKQKQQCKKK